jgi:hypothetical protein
MWMAAIISGSSRGTGMTTRRFDLNANTLLTAYYRDLPARHWYNHSARRDIMRDHIPDR